MLLKEINLAERIRQARIGHAGTKKNDLGATSAPGAHPGWSPPARCWQRPWALNRNHWKKPRAGHVWGLFRRSRAGSLLHCGLKQPEVSALDTETAQHTIFCHFGLIKLGDEHQRKKTCKMIATGGGGGAFCLFFFFGVICRQYIVHDSIAVNINGVTYSAGQDVATCPSVSPASWLKLLCLLTARPSRICSRESMVRPISVCPGRFYRCCLSVINNKVQAAALVQILRKNSSNFEHLQLLGYLGVLVQAVRYRYVLRSFERCMYYD